MPAEDASVPRSRVFTLTAASVVADGGAAAPAAASAPAAAGHTSARLAAEVTYATEYGAPYLRKWTQMKPMIAAVSTYSTTGSHGNDEPAASDAAPGSHRSLAANEMATSARPAHGAPSISASEAQ